MNPFDPYYEWLGIPVHEQPPDHYRLLGLPRFTGDAAEIEAAADERMAIVRTYQTGPRGPYTQKLLNELAAAKLCLLNPYSKAEYDAWLASARGGVLPVFDAMLPAPVPEPAGVTPPPYAPVSMPEAIPSHLEVDEPRSGLGRAALAMLFVVLLALGAWVLRIPIEKRLAAIPEVQERDGPPNGVSTAPDPNPPSATAGPVVILQEGSGFIVFPLSVATLEGQVAFEPLPVGEFLTGWRSIDDAATWHFKVIKLPSQGIFRVRISYFADRAASNAEYVLDVDGAEQSRSVRAYDRVVDDEFYMAVNGSGEHTLTFFVDNLPKDATFGLKLIELSVPRTVSGPDS